MAWYQDGSFLQKVNLGEFSKTYSPGERTSWSGIYRCDVCGHEIVHTIDHPLPPQNHHTHPMYQPIKWRLTVTDKAV